MPLIPFKWKQYFYPIIMLLGRKYKMMNPENNNLPVSIYDIAVKNIDGVLTDLSIYKGKLLLIVNVATECGYTPQYEQLEELYEKYKDKLEILGFPCNDFGAQEPGTDAQIKFFCTETYHVTFPMFSKIHAIGDEQHPVYKWLSNKNQNGWNDKAPTWNFWKYLINGDGKLVGCFSQTVDPFDEQIMQDIDG